MVWISTVALQDGGCWGSWSNGTLDWLSSSSLAHLGVFCRGMWTTSMTQLDSNFAEALTVLFSSLPTTSLKDKFDDKVMHWLRTQRQQTHTRSPRSWSWGRSTMRPLLVCASLEWLARRVAHYSKGLGGSVPIRYWYNISIDNVLDFTNMRRLKAATRHFQHNILRTWLIPSSGRTWKWPDWKTLAYHTIGRCLRLGTSTTCLQTKRNPNGVLYLTKHSRS